MRSIMDQSLGKTNVGRPWWGDHEGDPLSDKDKNKLAWYGHFKYGLHEQLGSDVRYFTILREPVERFLSEYIRHEYRVKFGLSPIQLIQSLSSCIGFDQYGDNIQVRMLSGAGRGVHIDESHVDMAIVNLSEFYHIGFTDRYNETLDFFRGLGWKFHPVHLNKDPVVKIPEDEIKELKESPQLAFDYMLWNHVR